MVLSQKTTHHLDELRCKLKHTDWFATVGQYVSQHNNIAVHRLFCVKEKSFEIQIDSPQTDLIKMVWLPSSQTQVDPIYGAALLDAFKQVPEHRNKVMALYKDTMSYLRHVQCPAFIVGAHDLNYAAKSAALYSVRMAAIETVLDQQDQWHQICELYIQGHWVCGRLPNGSLVVY